jgi:hypothetical protein
MQKVLFRQIETSSEWCVHQMDWSPGLYSKFVGPFQHKILTAKDTHSSKYSVWKITIWKN